MDNAVLLRTFERGGLGVEEYRVPVLTASTNAPSSALIAWIKAGALKDDKTQPLIAARYRVGSDADEADARNWIASMWDIEYPEIQK